MIKCKTAGAIAAWKTKWPKKQTSPGQSHGLVQTYYYTKLTKKSL